MARTVKDREERRGELLETAMRLFVERGYEQVSMRDIARAAQVTPGLAYHYFDSKQKLFQAALDAYVQEITASAIETLDDGRLTLGQKLDALFDEISSEKNMRYHEFFHAEGNRAFHDQLSFALCERMIPHLLAAVKDDARRRGVEVVAPETLVNFIAYGQVRLMSEAAPDGKTLRLIRQYVEILLASQTRFPE